MKSKPRIMIVDDDQSNLIYMSEVLESDYELSLAGTGEEALDSVRQFDPDILLLDLMLPGIDGYEVLKQVRNDETLSSIKIILVTARAMLDEKLKGYESGADDYVTKPYQHEELLAKINVFLRLTKEEKKRKSAEEALRKAKENLEMAVVERTKALEALNLSLKKEIEEHKETVSELIKSEERYREFVNALPQVVFEMDTSSILTFANNIAFDLFQYQQNDFEKGLNPLDMVAPEYITHAQEDFKRILEGEVIKGNRYQLLKKDGSRFPVVLYAIRIMHKGEPVGIRGILMDASGSPNQPASGVSTN